MYRSGRRDMQIRDGERREVEEQQTRKLKEVMGWLEEDQASFNKAVKKGKLTGGGSRIGSNLKCPVCEKCVNRELNPDLYLGRVES